MPRSVIALMLGGLLVLITSCVVPTGSGAGDGEAARIPELDPDRPVSLVWESYNATGVTAGNDTVQQLVSRFEQQHPNIDVTVTAPLGGTADITGSVQRAQVAGNPPDVAQLIFSDLRFIARDLGVTALEDLVGSEAIEQHFTAGENPYHPRVATLADLEGKTWGVPYVFSTPVLFYNADVFRAAGLDPESPPRNWDEVREAAVAIAGRTDAGGVYVNCVEEPGGGDWCLHGIVASNGGSALSEDGTRLTWAEPEAVEAIGTLQTIAAAGPDVFPDATGDDAIDRFTRGDLGMLLTSSALQSNFLDNGAFELRLAPMPGFGDRPASPTNSGSALFIMAEDPAKQAAAWELIQFLTSPEAQTLITETTGYVPPRRGLIDDPRYLAPFADRRRDLLEPNVAQLDRLVAWPSFPGRDYNRIRTELMDAVSAVVFRGADPATTLGAAQQRSEGLMP